MTGADSAPIKKVSAWNIANYLTVLRILLVPLVVWLLLRQGGDDSSDRWLAFLAFVIAAVTDRIDGELARRKGLITDFGKLMDPIADKALIGAALISLSLIGDLWWWVTLVILAREAAITLMRFIVIRHGVIAASRGGKIKTVLQSFAVGMMIVPLGGLWHAVAVLVMAAALIVTVVTGVDYALAARRAHHERSAGR